MRKQIIISINIFIKHQTLCIRGRSFLCAHQNTQQPSVCQVTHFVPLYFDNCRYQNELNRYSAMWREERSGFDEAIYWIELLIKFGNFDHLKIHDKHLNVLQYFCFDVFLLYFIIINLNIYVLFKCFLYFKSNFLQNNAKLKVHQQNSLSK